MSAVPPSTQAYSELRLQQEAQDPLRDITIDFDAIRGFLKRSIGLMIVGILIGGLLAVGLAMATSKKYTASTRVLYGTLKGDDVAGQTTLEPGFGDNLVDAQIELIRSNTVMKRVIAELDLINGPLGRAEFGRPSPLATLFGTLPKPLDETALLEAIGKRLEVERVGRSQVVQISYTSSDPEFAALMTNTIGKVYVDQQLEANSAVAESTAAWTTTQIDELRGKMEAKEQAIQTFKADNNLYGADGRMIGAEDQLTEINAQLIRAEADVAQARTRRDRLVLIQQSDPTALLAEFRGNNAIEALHERYMTVDQRYQHLLNRLGSTHQLVQRELRSLNDVRRQIDQEAGRAITAANAEVEASGSRVTWLRANRTSLMEQIRRSDAAAGQLVQMQVEADALRKAYESNLTRYQREMHNQSYPVANARIIEVADVPERPSSRGTIVLVAIGCMAGLLGGLFLAFLTDGRRRRRSEAVAL
ncbi:GumC family protein [Ancylobacter sp. A5.8]|uniref:GumC family protein n=1 Tax=Ancylobacter gelatini TaxID=2919920 RepID=UPI001F4E736B|nr:GumC family protein [Ancylobacter gelatini]MCJ8141348.1 GumC family protein [Ancylobacter gelatini]